MSDDIHPSDYYDIVGEDVRRADHEKMWLRRGIAIGREEGPLAANRRVASFSDTTPREKDLLKHGVAIGQASKLAPSSDFSEERIEQIYRERIKDQGLEFKSGPEFWTAARESLGYTKENGYEENNLLLRPNEYQEVSHTGRETEYGDYTMEVKFDVGCEDLSHKIAIETRPVPIADYRQTLGERLKEASVTMKEIDPERRTAQVEQEPPLPWYEYSAYGGSVEMEHEIEPEVER